MPKVRLPHFLMIGIIAHTKRVAAGSFSRLSAASALWSAWKNCRKGKWRHPNIAAYDLDADRHIMRLHRDLSSGRYAPGEWRLRIICDPKLQLIAAPALHDRIIHRALVDEIGPIYERSFIEHSYTGTIGRGPHRAVLQYLIWMRRYRHRLHLDIKSYFRSIHLPTLEHLLFTCLHDRKTRALLHDLLSAGNRVYRSPMAANLPGHNPKLHPSNRGLPLGSYLSQWAGTYYLNGMDHFIKRELKVPGYLRYMDDFVLFDNSKQKLLESREAISAWLSKNRGLGLNPKRWAVEPNRSSGVFLGYRISRAGTAPSRKLRRRFRSRLRTTAQKGYDPLVCTIRSYRGLLLF